MGECIFCRIVSGDAPCRKVYEDEHALVFMDIAGDIDGHMVAIPKRHFEGMQDCPAEVLAQLMHAVQRVSQHCAGKCGYPGVNLLNASGACAGQSVPHLHFHIIPRRPGDGADTWPVLPGASGDAKLIYEALRMK